MCESAKNITFCTCLENGTKNNRADAGKSSRVYRWTLSKYVGKADSTMDGLLMEPADLLSENISDTGLAAELNARNCFDFDYQPNEGDNLEVWAERGNQGGPMSFIFTNGQWQIRQYNSFTAKTEKISSGKVKFD